MAGIWVLVANGVEAEIYAAEAHDGELVLVEALHNPDARVKKMDLTRSRPGRAFDSHGTGRHAMEPEHDVRDHLHTQFAKVIVQRLEQGRERGEFAQLVLTASPPMLGLLRAHMHPPLQAMVTRELDHDYTGLQASDLHARLGALR